MPGPLTTDTIAIWHAGVEAVRSDRLVTTNLQIDGDFLLIGEHAVALQDINRIAVVGAGKAGAGMVAGVEQTLAPLADAKQLHGWVNVPDNCIRPTRWIHLHPARPAGVNEPTAAGVEGTERILEIVSQLASDDLCICLISGGGSALMPAPAESLTLEDKLRVTRFLSAAGANIAQLNTVRKQLSRIKGGGLARACRAGRLATLIISDVLGDPLDLIASGPTVPDASTPQQAYEILLQFHFEKEPNSERILHFLQKRRPKTTAADRGADQQRWHVVIGNNATAVDAAGLKADSLGYRPAMVCAQAAEGDAEVVAQHLSQMALRMRHSPGPDCLISGGEPVVRLAPAAVRGRGGRNQQLVLAAYRELVSELPADDPAWQDIVILSAGTDGEDGPTDAAGAYLDQAVAAAARQRNLDFESALRRNDAYTFFEQAGGLLRTGPTHTNVCDVRVLLVRQQSGDRRAV